MYNGIGIGSARGSGTNGYVVANKFAHRRRAGRGGVDGRYRSDGGEGLVRAQRGGGARAPNADILRHDRKRQVELKLLKLTDELEEKGCVRTRLPRVP